MKNLDNKDFKPDGQTHQGKKPGAGGRKPKPNNDRNSKAPVGKRYEDCRSNDIKWWNRDTIQYELATRKSFPYNRGEVVSILDSGAEHIIRSDILIPAAMVYDFIPTIGWCDSVNSPQNRFFNNLYQKIQSKTNGVDAIFQAGSMALVMTGLSSLASLFAHVSRAIRTLGKYSKHNYYWPRALYAAEGFSPDAFDDDVKALPLICSRYNYLVRSFNVLCVPNFITTFNRHFSLAYNVYIEENNEVSEVYLYRPKAYYVYDDVNDKLIANEIEYWKASQSTTRTIEYMLDYIEVALEAYRNSSIFSKINSYLIRTFEDSVYARLEQIDPNNVPALDMWVDPVLNIQTQNMKILPSYHVESFNMEVDAINNAVISKPRAFNGMDPVVPANRPFREVGCINLPYGWVDAESVMESTRLTPYLIEDPTKGDEIHCGTEVIVGAQFIGYEFNPFTGINNYELYHWDYEQFLTLENIQGRSPASWVFVQQFKYRPLQYVFTDEMSPSAEDWSERGLWGIMNNLQVFNKLTSDDLELLHDAAHSSAWFLDDIPNVKTAR